MLVLLVFIIFHNPTSCRALILIVVKKEGCLSVYLLCLVQFELSLVKQKMVLDPVILNQNKSGFFHRIQNLCKPQALESITESLPS